MPTRANDRHIYEDMQPHLPIFECSPDVTSGKMFVLANRRVIIFCRLCRFNRGLHERKKRVYSLCALRMNVPLELGRPL